MSGKDQNAVASLEMLPPEILLPIVTSLPGLDTLWSLMTASPNVWRLFNNYALTITEGIISGPNSILYERIQELVRGFILVRAKTLPFKDLNEFKTQFLYGMVYDKQKDEKSMTLGPGILFASIVPVDVSRSVVATACHLSALSQGCLASYLASFKEIKPPQASHPLFSRLSQIPSCFKIDSETVKVVDVGQPRWTEEMRALRAMWTIQLVGDMKRLDKETWSKEDIDMLQQMHTARFGSSVDSWVKAQEIRSAMNYLTTLEDTMQGHYYRLPMPPLATKRNRWITAERKTFRSAASAVIPKPLRRRRVPELRMHRESASTTVLNEDNIWERVEPDLDRESVGLFNWGLLTDQDKSLVYGAKFDSFRRLGFAFWDKKRLSLAGLANGIHGASYVYPPSFHLFALETILPADEFATIKAEDLQRPLVLNAPMPPLLPGMSMARSRHLPNCRPGNPRPAPPS